MKPRSGIASLLRSSDGISRAGAIAIGILAVPLIGVLDYITGPQISSSLFYLLPVMFVARRAGRGAGLWMALAAAATWLVADLSPSAVYPHFLIPYWNAVMRFGVFAIVVLLISAMWSLNRGLEKRVQERAAELEAEIRERRKLEKKILEVSDREQARIGQDIHDGLCQHLVSTAFASSMVEQKLAGRNQPESSEVREISTLLDDAITQARVLARGLYPVRLESEGLATALEELAGNVGNRFGVVCSARCSGKSPRPDHAAAIHLYRIAQEAVTNAIRHGKARCVEIQLSSAGGEAVLTIDDDGTGIAPLAHDSDGMGLHIMEYRARMIGGTLQIGPSPAGGTRVACRAPITTTSD